MPATMKAKPRKAARKAAPRKNAAASALAIKPLSIADSLVRDWNSIPEIEKTYALRTVNSQRQSMHNNWQWPKPGKLVIAPDWRAANCCGYGLHGLLHGDGRHELISFDKDAVGQVVQVVKAEVLHITSDGGGKVKFPRCVEVFTGTLRDAVRQLLKLDPDASGGRVPFAQVTDDRNNETIANPAGAGTVSATGTRGASSATGDNGASSATGDNGASSATGFQGASSATGFQGASSATGFQGASSATGTRGASSATGKAGIALARNGSRARAGEDGVLILIDDTGPRPRAVVRYVGEDGIKPKTFYKLVNGNVVESPDDDRDYQHTILDVEKYCAETLAANEALERAKKLPEKRDAE